VYGVPLVTPDTGAKAGTLGANSPQGTVIAQSVDIAVSAGQKFCASTRLSNWGKTGGGAGWLLVVGTGGTSEWSSQRYTGLVINGYATVSTCFTATSAHTGLQLQVLPDSGPTLIIDTSSLKKV
jgi:hypothetical protein